MKTSELIKLLQEVVEVDGDVEVEIALYNNDEDVTVAPILNVMPDTEDIGKVEKVYIQNFSY